MDDGSASSPKPGVNWVVLHYAASSSKKGQCCSSSYPCPLQSRGSLISCLHEDMSSEPLLFLASNDLEELAGNRD